MARARSNVNNSNQPTTSNQDSIGNTLLSTLNIETRNGTSANTMETVRIVSEFLLEKYKHISEDKAISAQVLFNKYQELRESTQDLPEINKNSFVVYLSRIANTPGSKIICPGRRRGYYYDENYTPLGDEEETGDVIKEADLYSLAKEWLFEKCDIAVDVSQKTANRAWGNPDLVGFKLYDILNKTLFEIYTIELKLTPDGWRRWIFEAVSHTRFSNRSYFAFLYPENWISKLEGEDMRLYAEHFRIGILVLAVTEELYKSVKKNHQIPKLEISDVSFIEYLPAPYISTRPKFRNDFLTSLGINNYRQLHQFGESID